MSNVRQHDTVLPLADTVSLIAAPQVATPALPFAWLRLEFTSGRRFEIAPVEREFANERYPRLSIEVVEVSQFSVPREWPGGPSVAFLVPADLRNVAGHQVLSQAFTSSYGEGTLDEYLAELSDGSSLQVSHCQATPMTLLASHNRRSDGVA